MWLSVAREDFMEEVKLQLGLDAQVGKFDWKTNTSQVWNESLVVICNDLVDDNLSFYVNISVTMEVRLYQDLHLIQVTQVQLLLPLPLQHFDL